ncbi:MAG: dNTP triphosphohydrolase [Chloroflexota bacterium]|nr:dNTP triphosphohydrolase [Chloroflexota bacterium]
MNDRYARFHPREGNNPEDRRSPGRRDRDRILYSSALRRLSGITQVVSVGDRHPIHNRLTHTLEVAQIGRSLAENLLRSEPNRELVDALGGLDPDVVEAACLAHDLGHPPFGHVTEAELDRLVKDEKQVADGYEGNPQSFRILTKLSVRYRDTPGLNLTRATLCAVLKYPWPRGTRDDNAKKWGAYASEEQEFRWARALFPGPHDQRSLEAELMDWADDVAYAVHDVEDFYRAGIIPLDRLANSATERDWFIQVELERNVRLKEYEPENLARAFGEMIQISPIFEPYRGSHEGRARLRSFTSSLVDRYIKAVTLSGAAGGSAVFVVDPEARMEVAMLKGLTWQYVIESRALITQRYGHKRLIKSLFQILCEAGSREKDRRIFPEFYQELLGGKPDDATIVRTVADLIASMTESRVIEMHHRLTGVSLGGSLDPILP